MNQDNNPKFSHIIVGNASNGNSAQKDEEEVIVIGAVVPMVEFEEQIEKASTAIPRTGSVGEDSNKCETKDFEAALPDRGLSEEDLQISSMPLIQKLILAFCAVAFAIAILLVVWHWIT